MHIQIRNLLVNANTISGWAKATNHTRTCKLGIYLYMEVELMVHANTILESAKTTIHICTPNLRIYMYMQLMVHVNLT
jgi:hypothetical protein